MKTNCTGYPPSAAFFTLVSCILLSTLLTTHAAAIDIVDRSKAEEVIQGKKDPIPFVSQEGEDTIDATQEKASEYLISAATWFDSFFDNERYTAEVNRTRAKLQLTTGVDKHEDFEFKTRLRWKLHLPSINKRLNLLISANDDEDFNVERGAGNLNSRDDDSDLSAALQYFLLQTKSMNISTTAGFSYNYAYAGVRYRGQYDYGSWQGRLVSRLRYFTDDGWEARNQYDIERQVSDTLLFRSTVDASWQEKENGLPHGLIFSLFQVIGADRALSYEIGNYFNTRPSYQMTDVLLRLSYRQRFYRDWLVFEAAPQVSFPKEYDREFNPGIIFKLEAEFGYKSYQEQFNNIFSF